MNERHFDLDFYGAPGVRIIPRVDGSSAAVETEFYVNAPSDCLIQYTISDMDGNAVISGETAADSARVFPKIENVHLWDGVDDPYLYTLTAKLIFGGEETDEISAKFGCRSFRIDPQKGFILNGRPYPLRGVSRHQDRPVIGNALTEKEHREDMELICEVGANTIRLAHYQHSQTFYDLCDEKGMIVWAEIPYISKHMPTGEENTLSQMKELIYQNINHPSIVVWGLSNEITMNGAGDASLLENHRKLI